MQGTVQVFVKRGIKTIGNCSQGSWCLSRESNQAFSEYKSEAMLFEPPYSILSVSFCGSALTYVYFAYFNFPVYVSRKQNQLKLTMCLLENTWSLDNAALYECIYGMAWTTSVFSPLLDANSSISVSVNCVCAPRDVPWCWPPLNSNKYGLFPIELF